MSERAVIARNGQWFLEKWNMEKRCWEGYEPVPGKKPFSDGSCRPVKKEEGRTAPNDRRGDKTPYPEILGKSEVEINLFDNGDIDVFFGEDVSSEYEDTLMGLLEKKEWSPKAEHKSAKGGLTEAGRKSYNRATGGNLKAPQPDGGPRKRSFCARNKGQIKMHGIDCKKDPEKRACKARRRCKCSN